MRICLITEYFYPDDAGGTPTVLSELARYIADHWEDVKIDVITSRNLYRSQHAKLSSFQDWDGVRIFRLRAPKSNRPSSTLRLAAGMCFACAAFFRLLRLGRYDLVVVGTNPPPTPMAALALNILRRTPFAYLVHDLYPDVGVALGALKPDGILARLSRWQQRNWLHRAADVVVLGRCMRSHLVNLYELPRDRVTVIPSWGDPERIQPMSKASRFRGKHGLNGFVVLYSGNLGQSQSLQWVVDAARSVQAAGADVTFVIVGRGARRDDIARRVLDSGATNVRMFDPVGAEDYPDLLASADVSLVLLEPSLSGLSVPSKFYSILASGRPPIAVVGEDSEVARAISEAECGVWVGHGDPQELAEVIVRLRNSPDLLDRMGANARRALEENYTISAAASKFVQVFARAAGSRDGAGR